MRIEEEGFLKRAGDQGIKEEPQWFWTGKQGSNECIWKWMVRNSHARNEVQVASSSAAESVRLSPGGECIYQKQNWSEKGGWASRGTRFLVIIIHRRTNSPSNLSAVHLLLSVLLKRLWMTTMSLSAFGVFLSIWLALRRLWTETSSNPVFPFL